MRWMEHRQEPYPPTPEGVSFLLQIRTNSEVFKRHDLNADVIVIIRSADVTASAGFTAALC